MGATHGVTRAVGGPRHLVRGFGAWRRRPGLMATGILPALLVGTVLLVGFVVLVSQVGDLAAWLTPFVDGSGDGLRTLVRLAVGAFLVVGYLAGSAVLFVALTLLVGEPFYARIWRGTEADLGGPQPEGEVGWKRSLADSVVLVARGLLAAIVLLAIGLVPVVGSAVAAVGGVSVASWVLASELLARPLEGRGMAAAERRRLLRTNPGAVLGFGLAVQACFWIPLGAVVVMPAAVVGATSLARDLLAHQEAGEAGDPDALD